MRALVLSHVFPRSDGDPNAGFLLTWAHALQAAGQRLLVVAPHDAGLPAWSRVGGIPVRFVRYAPDDLEVLAYRGEMHRIARSLEGPLLLSGLVGRLAWTLRRLVRRTKPDVLHVHWWLPGAVIARLAGVAVPTVVHLHGTDVTLLEGRSDLPRLARWALAGTDRVEVVSSDLGERLERATGLRADAVNPMPLAPSRLRPLDTRRPTDPPTVLALGRLLVEKGFSDLVDAVTGLDVKLVIAGDGPEREGLAGLAAMRGVDLELPGAVEFDGVRELYARADLVVQPSWQEGLGMVAAEAAVLGVPVVATDSGGVRDVLGPDGLVPPGDLTALRAAILQALAQPRRPDTEHLRTWLSPEAAAERTVAGWGACATARSSARSRPRGGRPVRPIRP